MQASFTDLVGTAVVPAHCFDSAELTDLPPALYTVTAVNDLFSDAVLPTPASMGFDGHQRCCFD